MPDKPIMFDSPEAAHPATIEGWMDSNGHFYLDERSARYMGCTHLPCDDCGAPVPKTSTVCTDCRELRAQARYESRPEAPWDGTQMVYSEALDEFYASPDDAGEESGLDVASLRLVLCNPVHVRQLDPDDFSDDLPDDGEAPDELIEAIDAFNAAARCVVLSWVPGRARLKDVSHA